MPFGAGREDGLEVSGRHCRFDYFFSSPFPIGADSALDVELMKVRGMKLQVQPVCWAFWYCSLWFTNFHLILDLEPPSGGIR